MSRRLLLAIIFLATICSYGQGTFIYDQQSSIDETPPNFGQGPTVQSQLPSAGQSFTPALSGIDFIRLKFDDAVVGDGLGASINLNLRIGSITGTILGTTAQVSMADGFRGGATFFFPNTVSLTPATTYYFELVLQSGGPWNVDLGSYNYPGGEVFRQGLPYPGGDYWFREGIVVPEPSSAALLLVAGTTLWTLRRIVRQ